MSAGNDETNDPRTPYEVLAQGTDALGKWLRDNPKLPFDIQGHNLIHVSLRGLSIDRAVNLKHCDLTENKTIVDIEIGRLDASFAKLNGARLEGKSKTVVLDLANLSDANLTEAVISNVSLRKANLDNTDLQDATLIDVDLANTKQVDTNWTNARVVRGSGLTAPTSPHTQKVKGFDTVKIGRGWWLMDPTWETIRFIGKLPLFGASYVGIIALWLWTELSTYYNAKVTAAKLYAAEDETQPVVVSLINRKRPTVSD